MIYKKAEHDFTAHTQFQNADDCELLIGSRASAFKSHLSSRHLSANLEQGDNDKKATDSNQDNEQNNGL